MDDHSINVRFDSESREALEKANFDMKMKIYYLEEEMRKIKKIGHGGHSMDEVEDLRSDIEALRLQLTQKDLELEQRK